MTDREKFEAWFAAERKELIERKVGIPALAAIEDANWKVWQAALASQQPADDGWIEWCGSSTVEVKFRDGQIGLGEVHEIYWRQYDGGHADIIAYRVVKP